MRCLCLLPFLLAATASAQTPGSCELGRAVARLDVSNVEAALLNHGGLFLGAESDDRIYAVPKFEGLSPLSRLGVSPLFAAGLWAGGLVDGEVRTAAASFARFAFTPGPLNDGATLPNPSDCSDFDRIYSVTILDLDGFEAGGALTADLRDWPVGLGAPAVTASGEPVLVTSRDQTLDLAAGERPRLSGSQTAFWVMNDVGRPRSIPGENPLGIEVRVTAFAIAGDELQGAEEATSITTRSLTEART